MRMDEYAEYVQNQLLKAKTEPIAKAQEPEPEMNPIDRLFEEARGHIVKAKPEPESTDNETPIDVMFRAARKGEFCY